MRYVLAVIFVCALGAPAACALPTVGSNLVAASKANTIVQVAKHKRAPAKRQSHGDNGIHPLVGSGGY
jgi:hypothetical protein